MYGVPLIGRQWGMIISSALMGVSLFLFSAINTEASNVGINIMEYFFQSMFNASDNPVVLTMELTLTYLQYPIWMDPRGVSSTHPRYCMWCRQLLGSTVQHCIAFDRDSSPGEKRQWTSLFGRIRGFRVHHLPDTAAAKVYGITELLTVHCRQIRGAHSAVYVG